MRLLNKLENYQSVKTMTLVDLYELSSEIRNFLIDSVSKTGGHLASNLGVVELTIALHKAFNFPDDKIIFDVGHQSYIHKILTGRIDGFSKLRQFGGLSGFPKSSESAFDVFNSGHSSDSISVALGLKRALDYKKDRARVIAFMGDGALTGGMAYEGLNDAGRSKTNIIIVLNENEMSISENVGGMSKYLLKIRTSLIYLRTKGTLTVILSKIPIIGKSLYKMISAFKNFFKYLLVHKNIFEELGFTYFGPVDGHNIKSLIKIFNRAKRAYGPVLIHTITKKGKGYKFAEERPADFHGTRPFDIKTGKMTAASVSFSDVFGDELCKIAEKNENIMAITAAMRHGTGLCEFSEKFPKRYFDVAIAEGHGVGVAAGMAVGGMIPVFPVYSSFLQRGYDQLITDVCAMNLHCIFGVDRAGIVGEDGETHQGFCDISYLTSIPNMTVMSPATFADLRFMLNTAVYSLNSPCAIRYPRGGENEALASFMPLASFSDNEFFIGKSQILKSGKDISLICEGKMVSEGLKLLKLLENDGIEAELINLRYIKPIDKETILSSLNKTKKGVVMENNTIYGGVYTQIRGFFDGELISVAIPDEFIRHGSCAELFEMLGMDAKSVYERIK